MRPSVHACLRNALKFTNWVLLVTGLAIALVAGFVLLEFERALDMRTGTLDRRILWQTPSGKVVSIRSQEIPHAVVTRLSVHVAAVVVLDARHGTPLHQRP